MSELLNELAEIAGPGGLLTGDEVASRASGIWRSDGIKAQAIVRPRTTEQVSRILKRCNEVGQSVVTHGGLTGLVEGAISAPDDIALSLERMTQIEDVNVVDRTMTVQAGVVLQAIQERGLRIVTDDGEFDVRCDAFAQPERVGPVDLALLTVKTYHSAQAAPAMRPLVGADTVVLCLQNGIDSYQPAVEVLGADRVMPGAAYIEAGLSEPGVVRQTGGVVRIEFGEIAGGDSERGRRIEQVLKDADIPAVFAADIHRTLWSKFLFIATMAGTTSLARETLAELMPRWEWRRVIVGCMEEIRGVAVAAGINLEPDIVEKTVAYMEGSLEQMHASMHSDLLAGRPLELEALNGAVVRVGEWVGVATPINDVIYAALKPLVGGTVG